MEEYNTRKVQQPLFTLKMLIANQSDNNANAEKVNYNAKKFKDKKQLNSKKAICHMP